MKNNKGFSLVELIIVIAIMAILVGVMAPQLIKYIEKTNVSSDTQLCDSVKTAITTAMMDPSVINANDNSIPQNSDFEDVDDIDNTKAFGAAVEEILGFDPDEINDHLKSSMSASSANDKANDVEFAIAGANSVHVRVAHSDSTGKKGKVATAPVIYVD